MTHIDDMTAPKMTRVTVRVPRTTLEQINEWVDTLGVRRSHFLGIALVAGVRSLIQASALEVSLAAESSSRSGISSPAERRAGHTLTDGDPVNLDALVQLANTLRSEVTSLQSEIADLKVQLHTQRTAGRKRS
jgi:hypothetical protein